jgi:hypothetical protein
VTLADDALTCTSALIVERARLRDDRGLLVNGRDLERPERFTLLAERGACVLVHERTGQRFVLRETECAAR